jgi:hypothetical protein
MNTDLLPHRFAEADVVAMACVGCPVTIPEQYAWIDGVVVGRRHTAELSHGHCALSSASSRHSGGTCLWHVTSDARHLAVW